MMQKTALKWPKTRIQRINLPARQLVGWRVLYSLHRRRVCRIFSDISYNGTRSAKAAAEDFASKESPYVAEFLALMRRLEPRTNTRFGMPGITRVNQSRERGAFWVAYWNNDEGRKLQKKFSVNAHGEDEAKQLAIKARKNGTAKYSKRYETLARKLKISIQI